MDRSFLSHDDVVAASRRYVCIRLATYESEAEARVLASFFTGRTGEVENTTFALVAPDGKTLLTRAGRSPDWAFRADDDGSAAEVMAREMERMAAPYEKKGAKAPAALPVAADLRRGVNIAACDLRPLTVVWGPAGKERDALVERAARLAWSDDFIGRTEWAVAGGDPDVEGKLLSGESGKAGLLVLQPDTYGTGAKVLARVAADASDEELAKVLKAGLAKFRAGKKDPAKHIREGERAGKRWEGEIPVTDPAERARRQ